MGPHFGWHDGAKQEMRGSAEGSDTRAVARKKSVGKSAEPSVEERLAALHRLQRLCEERQVDFDKWLQTIRDGRR